MVRTLLLLFFFIPGASFAQVSLARIFSDHVVLQREKPIPVWGWAKPGEKVTITLAGQNQTVKAAGDGKWVVRFKPLKAGGPHTISVNAKSGIAKVQDVLIGEVWLCSGQSNMEWPVSRADNYETERKNADFPQIRHFKVEHVVTLATEKDLKSGKWKQASSETVGDFTAVGFFFARELYQKLKVPIGILHSSWGGSQIEGWISKEAMAGSDEFRDYAQNLPQTWEQADLIMDRKLRTQLFKSSDYTPLESDESKYISGSADFSKWQSAPDPVGQWDWKGLMGFRGDGFMAKTVVLPDEMNEKPTTLSLAENDNKVEVYINGRLVSSDAVKGSRKIALPVNTWKVGDNQLVIKVGKVLSTSWFGPGLMGSNSDMYVEAGQQKVSLASDWKLMPSFAGKHEYAHLMNNVGTTIYNAMIAPLVPFAIRGTLWYQGESNAGRAYQYRRAFPLLIDNWRKLWQDPFSFYWVQLSSFGRDVNSNEGSTWAELREAQNMTLALPGTGMVVTTDIGNPKDIHPTNKQDVGKRLAAKALNKDYGMPNMPESPVFDKMETEGSKAIISVKYADDGLQVKNRYGYVTGFEIAGEDKVFHYAQALIHNGKIEISNTKINKPVAVRYNWSDATEDGQIFNLAGFPLAPFRTDSWTGLTEENKFN
ncbi:sialate O-acetylesterase [Dyadobacter luteus]|uniref:Sialate O-acetylesterase n=1 Tax=Dyadobacter luteus TaxID=2259619 RepID=A0A3D8Y4T4_9BACT|nr:sialate O-acetylesterase [Dyadobacter luteus]REA56616.1 sialate O-acetylesterase [Dyadobacter luteus]